MNIEVNEEAATGGTVTLIFLGLFATIAFGCQRQEQGATDRAQIQIEQQNQMMKDGLIQKLEPDHFTPVWTKP